MPESLGQQGGTLWVLLRVAPIWMAALFPRACGGICMQHMSAGKAPVGLQSTAAGLRDVDGLLVGNTDSCDTVQLPA